MTYFSNPALGQTWTNRAPRQSNPEFWVDVPGNIRLFISSTTVPIIRLHNRIKSVSSQHYYFHLQLMNLSWQERDDSATIHPLRAVPSATVAVQYVGHAQRNRTKTIGSDKKKQSTDLKNNLERLLSHE